MSLDAGEVKRLIDAATPCAARTACLSRRSLHRGPGRRVHHIRLDDLHLGDDRRRSSAHAEAPVDPLRAVPPSLAHELRTHLGQRQTGFLFESNRHTRYAPRTIQAIVKQAALAAGITKRVYPHLLRHSIATLLLQSGEMPLDQVQKFLGHRQIGTTQVYAETSLLSLGENYQRALRSLPGDRR